MSRLQMHKWVLAMPTGLIAALVLACSSDTTSKPAGDGASVRDQMGTLFGGADSLARAQRHQEAAERYSSALALQPDSLGAAKRALGSFWRAGRYDEAYRWGQRVLAREPDSLSVLFDVGVACGFLVELECVDSIFRRAIRLNPRYVYGYGELGFLAQARGSLPEAVRYMEAGYAAAPDDEFAVSGLAQMLIPAGQARRAIEVMTPRLEVNRQARAYGGRAMLTLYGWALLSVGDTLGAKAAFDEVLARLEQREREGQTTYQLYRERAAIHALRGESGAAFTAMTTAYDRGWRLYASWTLADPMFASMIGDQRVTALFETMRAETRAIRQRLGWDSPQ